MLGHLHRSISCADPEKGVHKANELRWQNKERGRGIASWSGTQRGHRSGIDSCDIRTRGEEFTDALLRIATRTKNLPPDLAKNHDHYLHGWPKP